jgi:hypothetical protein
LRDVDELELNARIIIFEIAVVVTPVSRATIAIVIPYRSINSRAIFFRILLICRRLRS